MAKVNMEMVEKVAQKLKTMPISGTALMFTESGQFPAVGDPRVLDYFFAGTMHDYGFFVGDKAGYVEPLYGEVEGARLKGSDLLWTLAIKVYRENGSQFFVPKNLAVLDFESFCQWLPEKYMFQDLLTRWKMSTNYGLYCICCSVDPATVVSIANHSTQPLRNFLNLTSTLPGYDQDVLLKKNILLAMILANRPEKFLKIGSDEKWPPIVDYHLMRVAERLGIVDLDPQEFGMLSKRVWVSKETEVGVRRATYDAVSVLIELSGKPMREIDFLLWSARRYCPEMSAPDCPKCVFNDICAKRVELFQPVFRTTNY